MPPADGVNGVGCGFPGAGDKEKRRQDCDRDGIQSGAVVTSSWTPSEHGA